MTPVVVNSSMNASYSDEDKGVINASLNIVLIVIALLMGIAIAIITVSSYTKRHAQRLYHLCRQA